MKMKNLQLIFITIIITSFIFGCSDNNPCEKSGTAENLVLSDSIKSFIENYEDADRIIFKAEDEEEITFMVSDIQDGMGEYQFIGICDEDPSRPQLKVGLTQGISLELTNFNEIPQPIFITLWEFPTPPENLSSREVIHISLVPVGLSSMQEEDLLLTIDFFIEQENLIFHDSLEIGDTIFYSVYEFDDSVNFPRYEIKYSTNEGIIFIKDKISERELIYDRKE